MTWWWSILVVTRRYGDSLGGGPVLGAATMMAVRCHCSAYVDDGFSDARV
jgi:hypothetical protein